MKVSAGYTFHSISQLFSSAGPSSYPVAMTWLQSNWLYFCRVSQPHWRPDHAHACNCNASLLITNFLSYLAEYLFAKDTTIPSQPSSSWILSTSSSLLPGPVTAWCCVFCLTNSQLPAQLSNLCARMNESLLLNTDMQSEKDLLCAISNKSSRL